MNDAGRITAKETKEERLQRRFEALAHDKRVLENPARLTDLQRLFVQSRKRAEDKADLKKVKKAAYALADKNQELTKLATKDTLTGLSNRRHIAEKYHNLLSHIARDGRKNERMTVMLFDLDHFKYINDTYGHDVGDDVLVHFSEILMKSFRAMDICGRWGGEEFVVIGTFPSEEKALEKANEVREKIAAKPFVLPDGRKIDLRVSGGLTSFDPKEISALLDPFIASADEGLYKAKAAGRNQIKIAPLEPAQETAATQPHCCLGKKHHAEAAPK